MNNSDLISKEQVENLCLRIIIRKVQELEETTDLSISTIGAVLDNIKEVGGYDEIRKDLEKYAEGYITEIVKQILEGILGGTIEVDESGKFVYHEMEFEDTEKAN